MTSNFYTHQISEFRRAKSSRSEETRIPISVRVQVSILWRDYLQSHELLNPHFILGLSSRKSSVGAICENILRRARRQSRGGKDH